MDVEVLKSKLSDCTGCNRKEDLESSENDQVRVKRKTLEAVLEKCQRALELLNTTNCVEEDDENRVDCDDDQQGDGSGRLRGEREVDELCDLLKSKVECPEFLDKIEGAQASLPQNISGMVLIKFEEELEPRNNFEEGSSWDVISDIDLWESTDIDVDQEDFVVVKQEDIVEGIACFMAAYLLSLKETKELTPNQLQEALSKTFSVKTKKGKLRKAWDGSKVIYNVASWGATAIGIYQNPVIIRVATNAFWTSCHVISKLL